MMRDKAEAAPSGLSCPMELVKGRFEARKGGTVGALGKQYGLGRPGVAYTASGTLITHGTPVNIDMKGPSGVSVHCEVIDDDRT